MQFVHRRKYRMKPPSEKILKAADIAEITGLPEEEIRDIAQRHGKRIPSQKLGRIQVYNEKAASLFTAIAKEEGRGKSVSFQGNDETGGPVVNKKAQTDTQSRLGSISRSRDEEKKTERATTGEKFPAGRVPKHLINTVAMQGKQFSRFADRLTKLENAAHADREAFRERIGQLEDQVATLQEQMLAVDAWIHYHDTRLDADEAQTIQLAEETHAWTEYVRGELAFLRLSWWKRRSQK